MPAQPRFEQVRRVEDVRGTRVERDDLRDSDVEVPRQPAEDRDVAPHVFLTISVLGVRDAYNVLILCHGEAAAIPTTVRVGE